MEGSFHTYMLLLFLLLNVQTCQKTAPDVPPNVIVIITDDQGWGDIGYNNPAVYTPNMDRLAAGGVVFKNHYSMPECTPTRVALFTGRYPGRFGTAGLQATNDPVLPKGTPTLASMFKSKGYSTYLCGKWHIGSSPEYGPNHYGFDESYGSLAGAVGMYDHRYRPGEYEIAWHRNLDTLPNHENGVHVTDLVARDAVNYIRRKHEKPFFLYLAFNAPHTPLDERGEFVGRPTQLSPTEAGRWLDEGRIRWFNDPAGRIQSEPDPEKRLFLAVVYHVDDAVGQVVQALEETGQRKNTLILFTSDNGPQVDWNGNAYPDDLHLDDFNQPIPMRGRKGDLYEGGIHVPGFANWPGHIAPGQADEPVHVVDWFPTLAGLIGYQPGSPLGLDGIDLAPVLWGNGSLPKRDLYWKWPRHTTRWALRYGDWKIVRYSPDEPYNPEDWKLYNLADDPMEETNAAGTHPEIREELHQLFLRQRARDKEEQGFF